MQIIIINQQNKIPISKRAIKKIVVKTLKILNPAFSTKKRKFTQPLHARAGFRARKGGVKANLKGVLTIVYVDNRTIQELNFRFLGKAYPTDVLSFDLSEGKRFAADVIISTEKARENSRLFKTQPLWEAKLYLIHGILHLFGYDDRKKKDRILMQRKTLQILKKI